MVLEYTESICRKKKTFLITIYKNSSKWIINLNIKLKTINLLDENTGKHLCNPGERQDFLDIYNAHSVIHKGTN